MFESLSVWGRRWPVGSSSPFLTELGWRGRTSAWRGLKSWVGCGRSPSWVGGLLALLLACGSTGAQAQSLSYRLDPDHTSVQFEVLHFGTSTLRGRFNDIQGQIRMNNSTEEGEVSMTVSLSSVSTGWPALDAALRGDKLFDVRRHPQAFFVSRNIVFEDGHPQELRGELTLANTSLPLTLRAVRFSCRPDPVHNTVCGGDFEAQLLRSEAGITYGVPFVGDRVRLKIQVEGWLQ